MTKRKAIWVTGAGITVAVLFLFFFFEDIREGVVPLFEWLDNLGPWAALWFVLIYVGLVVFLIPSLPLTLAAGFIFGVVWGSVYVVFSIVFGAAIAFLVARYLLHRRVTGWIRKYPKLERVSRGMGGREGWKIVMLLRYVPMFPAKLSNYAFGVTGIRLRDFLIGNFIGVVPYTIVNVWVGSLAANLASLGERDDRAWWEWALYLGGLVAAVFAVIYITRLARGAMDKNLEASEGAAEKAPEDADKAQPW